MDAVFARGARRVVDDPSLYVGGLGEPVGGRTFDTIVVVRGPETPDDEKFQTWLGYLEERLRILGQIHVVVIE
jgi:hypothetical protein